MALDIAQVADLLGEPDYTKYTLTFTPIEPVDIDGYRFFWFTLTVTDLGDEGLRYEAEGNGHRLTKNGKQIGNGGRHWVTPDLAEEIFNRVGHPFQTGENA